MASMAMASASYLISQCGHGVIISAQCGNLQYVTANRSILKKLTSVALSDCGPLISFRLCLWSIWSCGCLYEARLPIRGNVSWWWLSHSYHCGLSWLIWWYSCLGRSCLALGHSDCVTDSIKHSRSSNSTWLSLTWPSQMLCPRSVTVWLMTMT